MPTTTPVRPMLTERRNATVLIRSRSLFMVGRSTARNENSRLRLFVYPVHKRSLATRPANLSISTTEKIIAEQRPGLQPIANPRDAQPRTSDQVLEKKSWFVHPSPWRFVPMLRSDRDRKSTRLNSSHTVISY